MFMEVKPDFTFHKIKIKCEKATKIKWVNVRSRKEPRAYNLLTLGPPKLSDRNCKLAVKKTSKIWGLIIIFLLTGWNKEHAQVS